ncbi:uncharacterized protein LOC141816719 [Curcuma longa]|uniref:uncharacterized protein LOC141816719 n=3 Tax=Curcuma longa TaxID=136217 RepID=UPI003D9E4877
MLLQLLQEAFPKPNAIPNSHYEAKKLLKELGLTYEKIHVCKNDCILFWGEHENKDICPVCKESRYKYDGMNKKKNAQKILRYFPIKPRLKRLFISEHTAKDMRWHKEKRVETDGVLRHPADSESWKEFDMSHEIFASDPRNIRLGLATDGFNPFGNMSNAYSMWPVILVNYNLPPWKMMKPSYFIMSLLIPGPKSPGKEIDVYLRPLINDLKELWDDGVEAYDASTEQVFQLHAAVMWTIHDFPAYGTISGWSTKGYKACPVCLHETKSQRLRSKICYTCHRRFLNVHHPWRKNKYFNGKVEQERPPQQFSGYDILAQLDALPQVTFSKHPTLSKKRQRSSDDTNWVKKSIFFELEYWPDLKLRHNLDVMHIEKNICDALIGTLLNIDGKSKDTLKARLDLQDMGIRSELHLKKVGDKFSKPYASYTLTLEERREFCQFLKSVKFPDGYAANISKNVNANDGKLYGLKSHDCHVLLQRILPVAIRKFFPKDICGTLIELCEFFKKITARSLHIADLSKMEEEIVLILCKMERIFPPAFFDIMVHLAVHLPREAMLAGPVSSRWMYPFERYLGRLKKYVRNKARPEGSIAEGYIVNEALTFSSLYMSQIETRFTRPERNKDVQPVICNLSVFSQQARVFGNQHNQKLPATLHKKAHWYILNNCKEVDPYRNEHLQLLSHKVPSNQLLQYHERDFPQWFRDRMITLKNSTNSEITHELYYLALGPDVEVQLYDACIVNGIRYHTRSRDSRRTTQNSGVSVPSSDDGDNLDFFGVLKDVVQLFYSFKYKVQLFWCDWFQCNPKKKSMVEEFGFLCIDTSKTWYTDDPFILANQARQVYYLNDIKRGGHWKVVQKVQHREIYEVTEVDEAFEEIENNLDTDVNQDISSNEASSSSIVGEDLEISHLCRLDVEHQHLDMSNAQVELFMDAQSILNDEDIDTEVDSDADDHLSSTDDDSD